MARKAGKRSKSSDPGAKAQKGDWRHVALVTALLGAVLGTLVLGAVLQVTPEELSSGRQTLIDEGSPGADPLPLPETTPPTERAIAEPALTERPSPVAGGLAGRVSRDLQRLTAERSGWMLQLMAACDEANVERLVERSGADDRLHVLPVRLHDRPCFRVCWGPYATRAAAEGGTTSLPSVLGALPGSPTPKPIADLLP